MSDLTRLQNEILRRFRPRRTTVDDIPGFAGGTLGDQIHRDRVPEHPTRFLQEPQPQAGLTRPRTRLAPTPEIEQPTRPRSVFAPPPNVNAEGVADFRHGDEVEPVSMSRDRRTQPRDYVADDAQYLRDLESQPRNWKDKTVDAIRAANQAFGSNPNAFTPTKRERDILKAQGMLGRDVEIQKAQTAQEMAQMVPIYDTQGNVIGSAPRKTAAGTQVRATDTERRAGETKRRNDAYIADIEGRPAKERAERARKIWSAGLADGDPEFKAQLAKQMGLKEELPDTDKGTVQVDANGNFRIVHGRNATSNVVTDETDKPVGAWSPVQFKKAEEGRDRRARERNAQSERNAAIMAGGVVSRMGDPEVHRKNIGEIDEDMGEVDTEINGITTRQQKEGFLPTDAATLNQLKQRKNALERERRDEREKLGKIESAQSNRPSQSSVPQGKWSESRFVEAFKAKYKRAPTKAEIDANRR